MQLVYALVTLIGRISFFKRTIILIIKNPYRRLWRENMPKKPNFYAVAIGKNGPGICKTWSECKEQTHGYPGNKQRGFATRKECVEYIREKLSQPDWQDPETGSQANDTNLDHQLDPDLIRTRSGPSRSGNLEITKLWIWYPAYYKPIKYSLGKDNYRILIKSCKAEIPSPPKSIQVLPTQPKQLNFPVEKRWYGSFKCSCGRSWSSGYTWTVDNQPQTMQCQRCNTTVLPYKLVSSIFIMFILVKNQAVDWKFYLYDFAF